MTEQPRPFANPTPFRMSVEQFRLLSDAGAFQSYAKSELINGEVFVLTAQYRPHGMAKMDLYDLLRAALTATASEFRPVVEVTLDIPGDTAPEPDILLTSQPYGEGGVPVASVGLVIEVSDTTLRFDRTIKAELYATAAIAEYWIVDLEGRTIEQLWSPVGGGYERTRKIAFGQPLIAATLSDLILPTNGLG